MLKNIFVGFGVFCAVAWAILASPALGDTLPSPFVTSFIDVPRLDCGDTRGSGVRISATLIITAAHVTKEGLCTAFGKPVTNLSGEPGEDIAYSTAPMDDGFRAVISCDGIKAGERYLALGFPLGDAPAVEVLIGTNEKARQHQVQMIGVVYHGMSGGGVFDSDGRLVAIINATGEPFHYAYVTPLSSTYLCRAEGRS